MDLAAVGFDVDATSLTKGSAGLEELGQSAVRAGLQINRSTDGIVQSFAQTEGATQRAASGITDVQTRIDQLTGVTGTGAASVLAYGNELDRLRAKFNPLFAVSRQYESELQEIAAAERMGAISAIEAASARQRAAQMLTTSGQAARGYAAGAGVAAMQTANLTAQFNDIGVMLAAGQNPLMLAMQQGTQINQVFDQMRGKGGVLTGIAQAFTSMVSPVNLATLGIIAGGAALAQWAIGALSAGGEARTFADVMGDLNDAVSAYRQQADLANTSTVDMAVRFGELSGQVTETATFMAEFARAEAIYAMRDAVGELSLSFGDLSGAAFESGRVIVQDLEDVAYRFGELGIAGRAAQTDLELAFVQIQREMGTTDAQTIAIIESLRQLGAAEGVDEIVEASRQMSARFVDVFESVDAIPRPLLDIAKNAGLIGQSAAEIGTEFDATVESVGSLVSVLDEAVDRATEFEETRNRDMARAQQMLDVMNAEAQVLSLIAQYGEDSIEVARERYNIERNQYAATLATLNITDEMRRALLAAFDVEKQMELVNIAGPIQAAVGSAAALAQNLGIALSTAISLQSLTPTMVDEDAAMAVPVLSTSETRQRNRQAVDNIERLSAALGGSGTGGASGTGGSTGGLSEAAREAERAMEELESAIDSWGNRTRTPVEEFTDEMRALNDILEQSPEFAETYTRAVDELERELASALPMVDDVAGAFGDWVASGFNDFRGMVDSIWSSFQGLLSRMIAEAASRKILFALGFGGVGTAGAAAAQGAAAGATGAATTGGLLGAFGAAGSGLFGSIGGGTGLLGGLGNALSGGLSGVFGIGANAAAAGGGFAATLGAAIPVIGGVALAFAALKGKTKTLDEGLTIAADGAALTAATFENVQTSRLFGLVRNNSSSTGRVDSEVAASLDAAYGDIRANISGMAAQLGVGAEAFDNFSARIRLSTQGLTESQVEAALAAEFAALSDSMADLAFRAEFTRLEGESLFDTLRRLATEQASYRREGESSTEALTRMSSSLASVNSQFNRLGFSMLDASIASGDLASQITDIFGGVEGFAEGAEFYFRNFFTAAEQADVAQRQFADGIRSLGFQVVPQTMAETRALVDELMTTGQEVAAAGIIALSPLIVEMQSLRDEAAGASDGLTSASEALAALEAQGQTAAAERISLENEALRLMGETEELRRRELAALDPTNQALQRLIFGLEDAQAAFDDVDPTEFADRLSFERAQANALRGSQFSPDQAFLGPVETGVDPDGMIRQSEAEARLDEWQKNIIALLMRVDLNTERTAQTQRKWDKDGQPETRNDTATVINA